MVEYEIYKLNEGEKPKEQRSSLVAKIEGESVPRIGEEITLMTGNENVSTKKYIVKNVEHFVRVLDENPRLDLTYDSDIPSVFVSEIN